MADDTFTLPFEFARRAQAARLRRRGRAKRPKDVDADDGTPVRLSARQKQGNAYERHALMLLQRAGLVPLACNLRCRAGEIDLAMRERGTLVLVEVRARTCERFGGAAASVDRAKQLRLIRAAHCLLPSLVARHWSGQMPPVRFDVVAFEADQAIWLRHAFEVPMR